MLRAFLLVGIGGFFGSIARYGIGLALNKYFTKPFPVATLAVNLIGCFLIGLLFGIAQRNSELQSNWWLVLATGFCGGFTTFSAFALENNNLLADKHSMSAIGYTRFSVVFGIFLCKLGMILTAQS